MKLCSAAILAGGKSSRMGFNKALIKIGRQNLIEIIAAKLRGVFCVVMLVGNDLEPYSYLNLEMISDIFPGCGPLGGIHAALARSTTPYVFVTACDMPFLNVSLAAYLAEQATGFDVVIPRMAGHLEPLHAVYSKECLPIIESNIHKGEYKVTAFLPRVRVKYIEQEELQKVANPQEVFLNLNTPRDIKNAIRLIRGDKRA